LATSYWSFIPIAHAPASADTLLFLILKRLYAGENHPESTGRSHVEMVLSGRRYTTMAPTGTQQASCAAYVTIRSTLECAHIKLSTDAVTIGKYKEDHPCNPQSVRILAGNDPSHLEEVLDTNLRNDSNSERLELRHSAPVWQSDMAKRSLWDLRRENHTIVSLEDCCRMAK
jgi:hypothetical protein